MPTAAEVGSALPEPDLGSFTPEAVRFAIGAWPMRAAEELRSALVFHGIVAASRAVLPPALTARFAAVVHEELGHARLCAFVGGKLGAGPPRYDNEPVRRRLRALPEGRFRAAALITVEVAMGETVSSNLFRAGRRAATEPLTRAALESILVDEVRHQQLGWEALEALLPSLDEEERETLWAEVSRGLGAFEQQNAVPSLRLLESGAEFDPAYAALGVLSPEARVEAFYDAVEQRVLPKLDGLGLDGTRAWAERYQVGRTA